MKRLWIAVFLLLGLLAASLVNARWIHGLTQDYTAQLRQAQELVWQDRWETARALTQEVYSDWEKHSFPLHTLLRHSDTDQILLSFREVDQYLILREMDQYLAANARLISQLELLSEVEAATPENIL